MDTFFSRQSWNRWWRNKRYEFNSWQVNEVDEKGEPQPNYRNCFGNRKINAYVNMNNIAIERLEEEKKKKENKKDKSNEDYQKCVKAEREHVNSYKKAFRVKTATWTAATKRQNALDLPSDPEFMRFYNGLVKLRKKTSAQQTKTNKISREIEKIDKVVATYERVNDQIVEGDTNLDINAHMKKILPLLKSVNGRADEIDETFYEDQVVSVLDDIDEKTTANNIGSSESTAVKLQENDIASVIALLTGSSSDDSDNRSSSRSGSNKNASRKSTNRNQSSSSSSVIEDNFGISNDDDEEDEDEDDNIFLEVKTSKQKKRNPHEMSLINNDDNF